MVNLFREKWRQIAVLLIPVTLTIANVPNRGGSEGGQGWVENLSDKLDFWGSILPLLTRDDSMQTSFLLSLLALSVYWLGLMTFMSCYQLSGRHFLGTLLLGSIGAVFVQQNLRDAFLLSFSMLSLGLVEKYSRSSVIVLRYLFVVPLVLAVTFKYPSAIAIVLLIFLRFYINAFAINLRIALSILLASGVVILSGVILDRGLAKTFALERGFVEQSVMYYDLASFYCWSEDESTRSNALESLLPSLANRNPQDICLSHRPNAWIYLVNGGNFRSEGVEAPLTQLSGSKDLMKARNLRLGWIRTIAKDPVDYIQIKLIAATQILTVGNPFLYASQTFVDFRIPDVLSDFLWIPISLAIAFVGKVYLFSEFAFFMFCLFLIKSKKCRLRNGELMFHIALIHLVNILVLSLSYVSDEARYVFPLLLLSYILLFIHITPSKVKEKLL